MDEPVRPDGTGQEVEVDAVIAMRLLTSRLTHQRISGGNGGPWGDFQISTVKGVL